LDVVEAVGGAEDLSQCVGAYRVGGRLVLDHRVGHHPVGGPGPVADYDRWPLSVPAPAIQPVNSPDPSTLTHGIARLPVGQVG